MHCSTVRSDRLCSPPSCAAWRLIGLRSRAALESDEAVVDYLKQFSKGRRVAAIVGEPEIDGRFFYSDDLQGFNFQRGQSPLEPFLDRLLRDRDHPAPKAMAVQSEIIPDVLTGFETGESHGSRAYPTSSRAPGSATAFGYHRTLTTMKILASSSPAGDDSRFFRPSKCPTCIPDRSS